MSKRSAWCEFSKAEHKINELIENQKKIIRELKANKVK